MLSYAETVEKLGKLRRNEENMTPKQKQHFQISLDKLKCEICDSAVEILKQFLMTGFRIRMDDIEAMDLRKAATRIYREEKEAGELKRLQGVLLQTYSLDEFLKEACRWHDRMWYEAYAPYWLTHITETGNPEYPYHNDLIDMDWWEECHEWAATKIENGKRVTDYQRGVTVMLPPTKEMIEQDRARSAA